MNPNPAYRVLLHFSSPIKNSNFSYDLEDYVPTDTEEIYLKIYSFEQEIKRKEPSLYFKIKEFALGSKLKKTSAEISDFSEEISSKISSSKNISKDFTDLPFGELIELAEDLCFEIMYSNLVELDEEKNIHLQEKLFILQNIITPKMLEIKGEHYAYNIYQLSFSELRKINSLKSPRHKCNVIFQSINCLSSKFFKFFLKYF